MDDTKPESVVRLLGGDVSEDARKAAVNKVHAIALGCLGLGAAGLYYAAAAMAAGSTAYTVLAMLGLAVFGGYAYQGPPFRLSYKGLGEPICFAAFGPLATGAFYLALVSLYSLILFYFLFPFISVWAIGLTCRVLFFCSGGWCSWG